MKAPSAALAATETIAETKRFINDGSADLAAAKALDTQINSAGINLLRSGENAKPLAALSECSAAVKRVLQADVIFVTHQKRVLHTATGLGGLAVSGYRSTKYRVGKDYYRLNGSPLDAYGRIIRHRDFLQDGTLDPAVEATEINDLLCLQWREDLDQPPLDLADLSPETAQLINRHHFWTLGDKLNDIRKKIDSVEAPGNTHKRKRQKAFGYWWSLAQFHHTTLQGLHQNNRSAPPSRTFSIAAQEQGTDRVVDGAIRPTIHAWGAELSLDDPSRVVTFMRDNLELVLNSVNATQPPIASGRELILNTAQRVGYDLENDRMEAGMRQRLVMPAHQSGLVTI